MYKISIFICLVIALFICCGSNQKQLKSSEMNENPLIYIGTYTEKEGHVDGKAEGIYIYELDMRNGEIHKVGSSPFTTNPSFIDISPDGAYLFSVNETLKGSVSAFRITESGRKMEFINQSSSEGDYPCYVSVDKSGRYILTANYGTGTVAMLPLNQGMPGKAVAVDFHKGKGPTPRQESAHAHSIILSPDNRFAYSCDLGTDRIVVYRFMADSGKLESTSLNYSTQSGAGPRHLAFHQRLPAVYVVNELNGTIECMNRDSVTGALTFFQRIETVEQGKGNEAGCADIHITPGGDFLYASNRGNFNTLAMYKINQTTGGLTLTGYQGVKGRTPRNFAIDPTGTYLLVANQDSDNIVTFKIDPTSGKLIDIGISAKVPTPVCIKFLPSAVFSNN
jgi:6-phosphogluconolactonase